jgi:hypothetical protein
MHVRRHDRVASAAARALRADAALVDGALPEGSGIALAVEMAELPWKLRIVLTSTDRDAVTEELVRASGAAGFIPKEDLHVSALACWSPPAPSRHDPASPSSTHGAISHGWRRSARRTERAPRSA